MHRTHAIVLRRVAVGEKPFLYRVADWLRLRAVENIKIIVAEKNMRAANRNNGFLRRCANLVGNNVECPYQRRP
jgi:hypothetical protein